MNNAEHLAKLKRIEQLMDLNPEPETTEGKELEALVTEVEKFERIRYAFTPDEFENEIARLRQQVEALQREVAHYKTNWEAACDEVQRLQRENKALGIGLGHALETIENQKDEQRLDWVFAYCVIVWKESGKPITHGRDGIDALMSGENPAPTPSDR
jgi:regulator of replication initiation timing